MRNVLWNKISAKDNFFVNFGLRAKTCRTFGKKNSGELSFLHSACPEERFEEFFSGKKYIFVWFSDIEQKTFGHLAKK